jgi:hypothetical protein
MLKRDKVASGAPWIPKFTSVLFRMTVSGTNRTVWAGSTWRAGACGGMMNSILTRRVIDRSL